MVQFDYLVLSNRSNLRNSPLDEIKQYHLHRDDYSKLHFELHAARPYFEQYADKATLAHRHSFYQLIWFKQAGRHYIDYQVIDHPASTLFFINKNQVHYFCPDSANEGYLFHVNDFFLERFQGESSQRFAYTIFSEMGNPYVSLSEEDSAKLETLTGYIQLEIRVQAAFYREQVFHFFHTLLFQIERLRQQQGALILAENPDYELAITFKKLVYDNMRTFESLESYSSQLHISLKKLTSICKLYLHDTPANIIRQSKVLEAKRMLANQKSTIQEIAFDLGFDQPSYFTKYFKHNTGITPKAFQATIR